MPDLSPDERKAMLEAWAESFDSRMDADEGALFFESGFRAALSRVPSEQQTLLTTWKCEHCGYITHHSRPSVQQPSERLTPSDDERDLPPHDPPDDIYDLRLRLKRAIRWLREAEDIARVNKPAWPTADRIRTIYEQITEDVLNGRTSIPPVMARLRDAEQRVRELEGEPTDEEERAAARVLCEGEHRRFGWTTPRMPCADCLKAARAALCAARKAQDG